MDPYRFQPRSETDRRSRRSGGEDRWSRRGDYERDPVDPFEDQSEREELEFDPERGRRSFAQGQTRFDRGFEDFEEWQRPPQFSRPWDEGRRDPRRGGQAGRYGEESFASRVPRYGYQGQDYAPRQRGWDISPSDAQRFGTRSAPERSGGMHAGKGPKGYRRSDERIQEDLSERLTADPRIDASEVSISVRQGEVILEGSVSERSMKRATEDLAEEVNGVHEVHNRLRVEQRGAAESASSAERASPARVGGSHAAGSLPRSGETR